jgi:predicted nucleotidyltransferase
MNFGLSETTVTAIRNVLAGHPAVEEAVVFGSRALGREHSRSDVDIALRGQLAPLETEGIALELEELPVPVQFDVLSLEAIRHRGLREHIARVGKVLYSRQPQATATASLPNY